MFSNLSLSYEEYFNLCFIFNLITRPSTAAISAKFMKKIFEIKKNLKGRNAKKIWKTISHRVKIDNFQDHLPGNQK